MTFAWIVSQSSSIQVGDILKLKRDEQVPADSLVVQSSERSGVCYASSASFDGETSLKARHAVKFPVQSGAAESSRHVIL